MTFPQKSVAAGRLHGTISPGHEYGVRKKAAQFMFQIFLSQSHWPSSSFQCTMYLAQVAPFSPSRSSAWPISTAVSPAISTSSVVSVAPVIPSAAIPAWQNPLIATRPSMTGAPERQYPRPSRIYVVDRVTLPFVRLLLLILLDNAIHHTE